MTRRAKKDIALGIVMVLVSLGAIRLYAEALR
jgi:hypothetical protein